MKLANSLCLIALPILAAGAQAETPTRSIEFDGGRFAIDAPEAWASVDRGSPILEHELAVPPPDGADSAPARLTMMSAGGSVDANLARWLGQFQETDGGADRSDATIDKTEVAGMTATLLDLSGTYLEGRPFGPKTPRAGYRMVAAIVEHSPNRSYFFKLIGPEETVAPAAEPFRTLVESIRRP